MIGTLSNVAAIIVGTAIGCLLKKGIKPQYEAALYTAMGMAALGIGMENVVLNMPKSRYHVLFIVSLALGGLLGTVWNLSGRFDHLVNRFGGKGGLSQGLVDRGPGAGGRQRRQHHAVYQLHAGPSNRDGLRGQLWLGHGVVCAGFIGLAGQHLFNCQVPVGQLFQQRADR